MRSDIVITVAAFAVGLTMIAFAAPEPTPSPQWVVEGKVVEVYDGDTVVVEVRKRLRVRLLDCWAGEVRTRDAHEKSIGLKSRDALRKFEGGDCVLRIPGSTAIGKSFSMGRVLGDVFVDDTDLAAWQRRRGYAYATKQKLQDAIEKTRPE